MVQIKNVDDLVYDYNLCDIDQIGDEVFLECTSEPFEVPEGYINYDENDVPNVIDEYTEEAIKYILDKYLDKLIEIAKELGIEINSENFKKKKQEEVKKNRRLDEFFA